MESLGFNEILKRLEYFCAYQERCEFDVLEKIKKLGLQNPEKTEMLIKRLQKDGFLDQKRFVNSYITGKVSIKKWGVNKIRAGLVQKRIDPVIIARGIMEIDADLYQENLQALFEKKIIALKDYKTDYQQKSKVIRFLSGKGYSSEEIYRLF
ncbi:MAG: RecX family transcriptional regulator [Crocinitomicaceae bacterium]|nr:RecX family transcriptional regulator [Crocinitomicaceae bacterium]